MTTVQRMSVHILSYILSFVILIIIYYKRPRSPRVVWPPSDFSVISDARFRQSSRYCPSVSRRACARGQLKEGGLVHGGDAVSSHGRRLLVAGQDAARDGGSLTPPFPRQKRLFPRPDFHHRPAEAGEVLSRSASRVSWSRGHQKSPEFLDSNHLGSNEKKS
jgi:hypothetical protein